MRNGINISNHDVTIQDNILFKIKKIIITKKDRIGIVAMNGTGKTTFLKNIKAHNTFDTINSNWDIKMLDQLPSHENLSGGEIVKKELEKVFNSTADCVLLDEPTSNLDSKNIKWLINKISETDKAVVIVSHDRNFLNKTVNKILYIEDEYLQVYIGNYDEYEEEMNKKYEKDLNLYKKQQYKKKKIEQEIIKKKNISKNLQKIKKGVSSSDWKDSRVTGGYESKEKSIAKQAKSLEKRISREFNFKKTYIQKDIKIQATGNLSLKKGTTLYNLNKVQIRNKDNSILNLNNLKIEFGDHIGIIGDNGSGKTTILEYLYSRNIRDCEEIYVYDNVSVGYFDQLLKQSNNNYTVLDIVSENSEQDKQVIFDTLGSLSINKDDMFKRYENLSGGQKVRVNIAKVLLGNHHLLLLDEPNNYLDIYAIKALESYLKNYPSTFILVSHDETLVKNTCEKIFILENNKLIDARKNSRYSNNNTDIQKSFLKDLAIINGESKEMEDLNQYIKKKL